MDARARALFTSPSTAPTAIHNRQPQVRSLAEYLLGSDQVLGARAPLLAYNHFVEVWTRSHSCLQAHTFVLVRGGVRVRH